MPRRIFPQGFLILLLFALLFPARAAAKEKQHRHVLILHSYHPGYAWTDRIASGMQKVFSNSGLEINLQVEYLDVKRYRNPEYFSHILETIMHYKLQDRVFDLLLVSDNDALVFALRHRADLFAGVPIVFCGVNNFQPAMIAGVEEVTGVAEQPFFEDTVDLALRLHPETEEIVVIGGTRDRCDRANGKALRQVLAPLAKRCRLIFWDDVPLEELTARLAHLDRRSLVLLNSVVADRQGYVLPVAVSVPRLRRASAAPMYSFWRFFLGHGIVGGKLIDGRRQGRLAAELVLKIFAGVSPATLPVISDDSGRLMFDDRELTRFKIHRKLLPAESAFVHRPPPFLELRTEHLWSGLGIMTVLAAVLLINILLRIRSEKALRASEEQVRLLLNSTAEAIYGLDLDGVCTFCNPAAVRLLGYREPADLLGKWMHPLIHHTRPDGSPYAAGECRVCQVLEVGEGLHVHDEILWRADGTSFPVEYWSYPIQKKGRTIGAVVTFLDITERKQAEAALREANQELDAFVYRVSHDLRSPLTVIIGYAQHLCSVLEGGPHDEACQFLLEIEKQGERMTAMMEDLLILARVGRVERPAVAVDAGRVLGEVLREWRSRLAAEGLAVQTGSLPRLHLPETLLAEVFGNLIGNALRYAGRDGGPLEIGGERLGSRVRFHVRDHGPGVPEAERGRIFEVFYRGSEGKRVSGSGVGLATVMKIARLFNGTAWVEETPGGGSTFWVEVADAPFTASEAAPESRGALPG